VDEAAEVVVEPASQPATGGRETILVVDDDESVRALVRRILEGQGYTVVDADGPVAAVVAARAHTDGIDLLITDVVMPGQSGRDLAMDLAGVLPGLRVLYMSGYTRDAIVHRGILDPGIHFVSKPVSAEALLRTVREVLNGPAHG
jgi:DNA-binding NtrC family response regulator